MRKQILLANDTENWYHYGCTATSLGIIDTLRQLDWSVDTLPITESYKLANIPNSLDQFDDTRQQNSFIENNPKIFNKLDKVTHLVINGEGTLHGLKPVTIGLLYLAYIAKIKLNKHVSIINHSCYPCSDGHYDPQGLAETLYSKVYQALDFIAVREPMSYRFLERMQAHGSLAFDCMPLTIARHFRLSSLVPKRKVVLAGCVSFNQETIELYGRLIAALKEEGVTVEVLTGAAAYPAADDNNFIRLLSAHCPAGWRIVNARSLLEWLRCIGEAQLLISGRFHHTIAAVCMGTPFITFESNTPKISGIFELLGQPPPLSFNSPDLLEKTFKLVDARFAQRHDPNEILPTLESLAWENFTPFIVP